MKKFLFLVAGCFVVAATHAQDIIVKRNASAEEIQAKVVEIGENQIRYRKWANPDGPIYTINKSDVFFIRYESGDKEIITPYDAPTSQATSSATSASSSFGQQSQTIKERKPLRDKSWEIGLTAQAGLSSVFFEEDGWIGLGTGVSVDFNYFYNRYSSGMCGMSLGFTYNLLTSDDIPDNVSMPMLDLDLYWGNVGTTTSRFGGKLGMSLNFPLGCKMGDYDMGDATNVISVGSFVQAGWSLKHSDFGARLQYNFTNVFTDVDSSMFAFKLYYSYRF